MKVYAIVGADGRSNGLYTTKEEAEAGMKILTERADDYYHSCHIEEWILNQLSEETKP